MVKTQDFKIVKAEEGDVLKTLPLAKKFIQESHIKRFNEDIILEHLYFCLDNDNCFYYILTDGNDVKGFILGVISNMLFSDIKIATELAWYTDKDFRSGFKSIRLLKEFEKWSIENNCEKVIMASIESLNSEKINRVYERLGYKKLETSFAKDL